MARRAYDPDDPDRMQREAARGDNRAVQQFSAQDTFNQERERIRQIALANGLNPDHYANIGNWYDQSKLYEGAPVEHMRGNFSLNPDGTIPIQQVLHSYKGSGAEFEGIPLQQWLAGPSSPWRVNAAGTGATYDPTKWTYKANYSPKDSFMDNFGLYAIGALGGAGMAGLLPGTTAAFGGAAAPAATTAGSTAGTGAAGWGASFAPTITQGTVAGADLGLTLGAPASMAGGGVAGAMGAAPGFAGSFAPTLTAGAAGAGVGAGMTALDAARTASTGNTVREGLEKLTTGSKIADTIIGSAAAGAIGGALAPDKDPASEAAEKAAEEQRQLEAERQRRITEGTGAINQQFAGFNDDYYSNVAKAYRDHYNQLIAEQAAEAQRKVRLGWPGGTNTSGYARRVGDLNTDVERQYSDIATKSVDFANQQRSDLESNRSAILAALEGGSSLDTVANQASATAARLSAPPAYSPIGDLFARLTSIPANQALMRGSSGYESKPLRFNTGSPITYTR